MPALPSERTTRANGAAALVALCGWLAAGAAGATPTSGGFYTVDAVVTGDVASGDVVVVGDAIFVGQGGFGAANQSVVRIDGDGDTVIATGFNSLAGFAYDPVNDRLIVGDNGLEASGATTGDSIYAIADPFGSPPSPPSANTLEILPSGAVPGASDVVLDPGDASGDTLFVGDSSVAFPPAGEVLSVAIASGTAATLVPGFAFTAGLAVDGTTLYVGEAALDFSGNVFVFDTTSTDPPSLLANLPGGLFDLEVGADGNLYATSGGDIVRIDPGDGSKTTVASGFGFAGGLFAAADGRLYAVDGFAASGEENRVWVFTPVPEPGPAWLLAGALAAWARRRR